jgi:hypothetical protein
MKTATVEEIIEKLQKMPQDSPCFFRPKYYGTVEHTDSVPVNADGISQMENTEAEGDLPKNYVCFLC